MRKLLAVVLAACLLGCSTDDSEPLTRFKQPSPPPLEPQLLSGFRLVIGGNTEVKWKDPASRWCNLWLEHDKGKIKGRVSRPESEGEVQLVKIERQFNGRIDMEIKRTYSVADGSADLTESWIFRGYLRELTEFVEPETPFVVPKKDAFGEEEEPEERETVTYHGLVGECSVAIVTDLFDEESEDWIQRQNAREYRFRGIPFDEERGIYEIPWPEEDPFPKENPWGTNEELKKEPKKLKAALKKLRKFTKKGQSVKWNELPPVLEHEYRAKFGG